MKIIGNVRVGKADVSMSLAAHTRGVRSGNDPEKRQPGIRFVGDRAKGTAERSTGINPVNRNPIEPNMPNLSPA
ncbi:MAG: hypothetical protein R3C14_27000 [Caldilineaceae bacterium]